MTKPISFFLGDSLLQRSVFDNNDDNDDNNGNDDKEENDYKANDNG